MTSTIFKLAGLVVAFFAATQLLFWVLNLGTLGFMAGLGLIVVGGYGFYRAGQHVIRELKENVTNEYE